MQRLKDKIAIVTGASRGGGRGIALTLGEEGATVYVTGRSVRGAQTAQDLPGTTIEDTAEQVTARGGLGIPVQCDHTREAEVEALFDRLKREHGRLDIVVSNAWGGYEDYDGFDGVFWEQPLWRLDKMYVAGLRAHVVTSIFSARLMVPQRRGLLILTTTYMEPDRYINGSPFYDVIKTGINRLALVLASDLRPHNITALALSPGFMRTEGILKAFNTDETHWQTIPFLRDTETPFYVGRAVAALAADPNVSAKAGQLLISGSLAREYGFTDADGRYIPPYYLREAV